MVEHNVYFCASVPTQFSTITVHFLGNVHLEIVPFDFLFLKGFSIVTKGLHMAFLPLSNTPGPSPPLIVFFLRQHFYPSVSGLHPTTQNVLRM
jgi:hypothetical protein